MDPLEFERAVECCGRPEDVWREMVAFARECGVRRIAYHHLPPPAAPDAQLIRIENEGFGEALVAQYLSARFSGFAVLANLIQQNARPVYLNDVEHHADTTPREREHISAYRAAGVVNGLGIQAFGPNARNGIYALDLYPDPPRLPSRTLGTLRWACQIMHLRYCSLILPGLGTLPALSSREAEVLGWVALGKSNAAIAEILGISAHTVDAHLRRIYLKLGVVDRISAALRALGFGLISLDGKPAVTELR